MSSSTQQAQHKTRPAPTPHADAEYIDHGPDLPRTYPGQRARSMVVSPHLVRLSWEWSREGVDRWSVVARSSSGAELASTEIPEGSGEAWVHVPAGTHGEASIRAHRGDAVQVIATLPFETPPDGPAAAEATERWASWTADGAELVDAEPVAGAGLPDLELAGASGPASSHSLPLR